MWFMKTYPQVKLELSEEEWKLYTKPTYYFDYDHPEFETFYQEHFQKQLSPLENLIKFYYLIRDKILYNPYHFKIQKKYYKASYIVHIKKTFCIPKAIAFCAVARKLGFPSKIGFADVKNHLSSERFLQFLNSDVFAFHGYSEIFISKNFSHSGIWVKATPAFDQELCKKFNVEPLNFDGNKDSIFQEYNSTNHKFMEYIRDRGSFPDFPYEIVLKGLVEFYPNLAKRRTISGDLREEI